MKLTIVTIEKDYPEGMLRTLQSISNQEIPAGLFLQHLICEAKPGDARSLINLVKLNSISKVISSSDTGIYNAMNIGLKEAKKGWVMFLNAGDTLVGVNSLVNIYEVAECSTAKILQFKSFYNDNTSRPKKPYNFISLFLGRNMHIHPALLVNVEIIRELQFDESYKIAGDYKFVLQLLKRESIVFRDEVIANFEGNGVSATDIEGLVREMCRVRMETRPKSVPNICVKAWNSYFGFRLQKRMKILK